MLHLVLLAVVATHCCTTVLHLLLLAVDATHCRTAVLHSVLLAVAAIRFLLDPRYKITPVASAVKIGHIQTF